MCTEVGVNTGAPRGAGFEGCGGGSERARGRQKRREKEGHARGRKEYTVVGTSCLAVARVRVSEREEVEWGCFCCLLSSLFLWRNAPVVPWGCSCSGACRRNRAHTTVKRRKPRTGFPRRPFSPAQQTATCTHTDKAQVVLSRGRRRCGDGGTLYRCTRSTLQCSCRVLWPFAEWGCQVGARRGG